MSYTSNIQINRLMKFLIKYQHFTTGHLKHVPTFGHPKGISIAVTFARLSGTLTVKRQWSTYRWLATAGLFFMVTQKIASNRRKRKKIVGILRTFIHSPKFRDLRAKQEKEKKISEKQSSTALLGAT